MILENVRGVGEVAVERVDQTSAGRILNEVSRCRCDVGQLYGARGPEVPCHYRAAAFVTEEVVAADGVVGAEVEVLEDLDGSSEVDPGVVAGEVGSARLRE